MERQYPLLIWNGNNIININFNLDDTVTFEFSNREAITVNINELIEYEYKTYKVIDLIRLLHESIKTKI